MQSGRDPIFTSGGGTRSTANWADPVYVPTWHNLTGATEWDDLGNWDKCQWRADVGLAFIFLVLLVTPVGLGYTAWHRRSLTMMSIFVASLLFAVIGLRLTGLLLVGSVDIAGSIWRTRLAKSGQVKTF